MRNINEVPKEFNEYPGVYCSICDQSFDYWDGYDTNLRLCEGCANKEKWHLEKKNKVLSIVDAIKKNSHTHKSNTRYAVKQLHGENAIEITLWNDDSGEPLISEVFTSEDLLIIFQQYIRTI